MRKILIVEDERPLREAYGIMLSTQPYVVHLASNGKEALDLCTQNDYDLILLDLMMPEVNGLQFLEQRSEANIPLKKVIMLSNVSNSKDLTKCLALGAHKNVVKASLSPRQLLAMVRYEVEA